jgi:hypothetical protein
MSIPQIFVDMDGVLADFDAHHEAVFGFRSDKLADNVDWQKVRDTPGFYANIPPMADMDELWGFVSRLTPRPIVLTGVPYSVEEAPENKRGWVRRHLGEDVEVRCVKSKEKSLHCRPGDVLIDDWEKYRELWICRGGRWITHTSAESSIQQLLDMGIGL